MHSYERTLVDEARLRRQVHTKSVDATLRPLQRALHTHNTVMFAEQGFQSRDRAGNRRNRTLAFALALHAPNTSRATTVECPRVFVNTRSLEFVNWTRAGLLPSYALLETT